MESRTLDRTQRFLVIDGSNLLQFHPMLLEQNLEFSFSPNRPKPAQFVGPLPDQLAAFREFGKATQIVETVAESPSGTSIRVPTYVNEFWTSRQRAANRLHEI